MAMSNEKRIENEKRILRKMVTILGEHGWHPRQVDDGGDELVGAINAKEVVEAVTAVDEAQIMFVNGDDFNWVMIILGNGNDGYDLIADYTLSGAQWEEAMTKVNDWIEREQA